MSARQLIMTGPPKAHRRTPLCTTYDAGPWCECPSGDAYDRQPTRLPWDDRAGALQWLAEHTDYEVLTLLEAASREERPGLDVALLEKAYRNTEATVRVRRLAGSGEPFWVVFAREYAALSDTPEAET